MVETSIEAARRNDALLERSASKMPNHVTTRCEVGGDADLLQAFKELMFVKGKDGDHQAEPFTAFLASFKTVSAQPPP